MALRFPLSPEREIKKALAALVVQRHWRGRSLQRLANTEPGLFDRAAAVSKRAKPRDAYNAKPDQVAMVLHGAN